MDKLESEIRKEINEMNINLTLIDHLDETNDESLIVQKDFLNSTTIAATNSNNNKNSLTNSQISMISKHDGVADHDPDSNHFYNSPASLVIPTANETSRKEEKKDNFETTQNDTNNNLNNDTSVVKEKNTTSPLPATTSSIVQLLAPAKHIKIRRKLPASIFLGIFQLVLSLILAALGGLVIARNASLSMTGTGLWAGAICGIAGSLGLMNVKMAQTGFLAVSLVCVASSTLGLALVGIGVVRDANLSQQDVTIWGAVAAGSGLLFTLAVHFLVSVFSVYYSALRLCSRQSHHQLMENVINSNPAFISQQKVEDYINSLQVEPNVKDMMYQTMIQRNLTLNSEKCGSANSRDKLMSHYMGSGNQTLIHHPSTPNSRPVMLMPAGNGNGLPMIPMYPPQMMYPANLLPPGVPQFLYNGSMIPQSALNDTMMGPKPSRKRSMMRKVNDNRTVDRLRRKSDSDLENRQKAFTYTGMDRDIADNFLQQQEDKFNSSLTSNCIDCVDCVDCMDHINDNSQHYNHNYRNSFGRCNDVQM